MVTECLTEWWKFARSCENDGLTKSSDRIDWTGTATGQGEVGALCCQVVVGVRIGN